MQKIDFVLTDPRWGEYRDSITVTDDATPEQIEALKQERLAGWVNDLENPLAPPQDEEMING